MTTIPLEVKSEFDRSDALNAHIAKHVRTALRPYAQHVNRVDVRLFDANGPRAGSDDKVARVTISLVPSGRVVVAGTAEDVYASVTRAAGRAGAAVARRVERLIDRRRRTPGRAA